MACPFSHLDPAQQINSVIVVVIVCAGFRSAAAAATAAAVAVAAAAAFLLCRRSVVALVVISNAAAGFVLMMLHASCQLKNASKPNCQTLPYVGRYCSCLSAVAKTLQVTQGLIFLCCPYCSSSHPLHLPSMLLLIFLLLLFSSSLPLILSIDLHRTNRLFFRLGPQLDRWIILFYSRYLSTRSMFTS